MKTFHQFQTVRFPSLGYKKSLITGYKQLLNPKRYKRNPRIKYVVLEVINVPVEKQCCAGHHQHVVIFVDGERRTYSGLFFDNMPLKTCLVHSQGRSGY